MTKKKTKKAALVTVEFHDGTLAEINPDATICLVYMGTIGTEDDPVRHDGDLMVLGPPGTLGLTISAGGSIVPAGLWASHLVEPSQGLQVKLAEIAVYPSADAVMAIGMSPLLRIIGSTRQGLVLRRWEAHESARMPPRKRVLQALRERVRLYGDNAPPQALDISHIKPTRPANKSEPGFGPGAAAHAAQARETKAG